MIWSLLAFAALSAGHAELWITLVNRVYGLPIPIKTLHRIRGVHDVAVLGFPFLMYWRVGLAGPAAFFSGQWSALSPVWIAVFIASSIGLVGLIAAVLTWWLRTRPCMRIGSRTSFVALPTASTMKNSSSPAASRTEVVSPAAKLLTRLPFNQQFQLETTEKQLVPPNWPRELDGLSILHISDWHMCTTFSQQFYEAASQAASTVRADLIAFTGDLCDDLDCLDWLPSTLGTLAAPLGSWFILGNHDALIDHGVIRARMVDLGWNDLGGKTTRLDAGPGRIVLGGDETPWLNEMPNWSEEDHALPRVLLAHTPDRYPHHCGRGVDLILAGHTHGGQIVLPFVGPVYAPSLFGCRYPGGVYAHHWSVMHVSRGLAGMHPIRFGSRPEITRLVIRSPKCVSTREAARLQETGGVTSRVEARPRRNP